MTTPFSGNEHGRNHEFARMGELRDLALLAEKWASLTFELLGVYEDANGKSQRRSSGSGIFVAPCHAITARHVLNDLHNVNRDWADEVRRKKSGYFTLPYYGQALQIFDVYEPNRTAEWGVTRAWPDPVTDIASLELAPVDDDSKTMLDRMRPLFPTWSLLPPMVGASVVLVGQPRDKPSALGTVSAVGHFQCLRATVVENFETCRDRGMYNFPGFLVDCEVAHGMSGGPVFCDGHLCGIISGGLGDATYVAALWPLCLTEFQSPNLGILDRPIAYEELFERGQIKAVDWNRVRGNISYGMDNDRPVALLRPPGQAPLG